MAIEYTGLGHIALRAREKDYPKLEAFLTEVMDFPKSFELTNDKGEKWISYFRVGPGQYIEVLPGTPSNPCDYFDGTKSRSEHSHYHQCFQIRDHLSTIQNLEGEKGLHVSRNPDDSVGPCGSHCFSVKDPLGAEWGLIEFTPQSIQLLSDPAPIQDPESKHPFVTRLTHVAFACKNYEKMVDFYENKLGLVKASAIKFNEEIIEDYVRQDYPLHAKEGDEWISYFRISPKEFIALLNVPYNGENDLHNQEFHHFCLTVKDVYAAAQVLEENGVQLWHGPQWLNNPYRQPYAIEAEPPEDCGSISFSIHDPEGNEIEIMQYLEGSLQLKYDHD